MALEKARIPELLAPAGTLAAALAAYDAGADAVYAGLPRFNARERTENLSLDEMSKLIAYARKNGRKAYIALNTLIKESELTELAGLVAETSAMKPDAFIVQDLGVLRMIRDFFPGVPCHASTQMGIHNSVGVRMAQKLGLKRVILERQVSIDELRILMRHATLEIEVFVHGALCCGLSGRCLFSSWMGGWSGNRGKCKQPCRRRFFGRDGNGFFFSTMDLCLIDQVPLLKEIGVSSLKIEGRLRNPDYVKQTVSAYRLMLDAKQEEEGEVLSRAREILTKSLGRKWSTGFSSPEACSELIHHRGLGVSGLLCGDVVELKPNGFLVKVTRRIHLGDIIPVQPRSGDEGPAITITKLSVNGVPSSRALRDELAFIHCDKLVSVDGLVFKVGESFDTMLPRMAALPPLRPALDLSIHISSSGAKIELTNLRERPSWTLDEAFATAEKRPLSADTVRDEFAASSSEKFACGELKVEINGDLFIPASRLKQLRRDFWLWACEKARTEDLDSHPAQRLRNFTGWYSSQKSFAFSTAPENTYALARRDSVPKDCKGVAARPVADCGPDEEAILPAFCPEDKLSLLSAKIRAAYGRGVRRFRVTSLYQFELLRKLQDTVIASSFPLPACNSLAVAELKALGVSKAQAWLELESQEIVQLLARAPLLMEIFCFGRMPLLATRAVVPADGELRDVRGSLFTVDKSAEEYLTCVYPALALALPSVQGVANYYDLTHASLEENESSRFNYDRALS